MLDIVGSRYELHRDESELKEIEKDLAQYLDVPYVRCSYDVVNSHKSKDTEEIEYRKKLTKEDGFFERLDYIINYEKYEGYEDYTEHQGGYDGQVHELLYLKGNGNYIVITEIDE